MNEPQFNVLDIVGDSMLVETTGLYRVIEHKQDGSTEARGELLIAEDAIFQASCHNNLRSLRENSWCEVISYADWQNRDAQESERERREQWLERRLKEISDSQPQPRIGVVRRMLTRAAALVW